MKPTSDKVFLDTNIIVYAHTDLEPQKQKTAQQIVAEYQTVISTQVLQETANTLVRKFKHSWPDVAKVANEAIQNNILHVNSDSTILEAFRIAERYGFSFYDSCAVLKFVYTFYINPILSLQNTFLIMVNEEPELFGLE